MLDAVVYNVLKEKLADTEYPVEIEGKKVKLVDWLVSVEEKSSAAIKIQEANKDLTTQREAWEKTKKDLETEIAGLKEKTAKIDKKGMNEEGEAKLNAAVKMAEDAQAKIAELANQLNAEKTAKIESELRAEEANLRKDLIEKLSGKKILDNSAKLAINTLITEGMASVVKKEDGSLERRFRLYDGNRVPLAATLDAVVEQFAKDNPNLISGTPQKGAGTHAISTENANGSDVSSVGFQSMVRTMAKT